MDPVSCVSYVSWVYCVYAAETHETFRQESGMRYQFRHSAPILSVNRGFFVPADSAVPSFVPSNVRPALRRADGPPGPAQSE
jgi:hypothetical protein